MVARNVEYVELYVTDRRSAEDYFVRSLGFARVAESADPQRNSVLLRQGRAQVVVSTGPVCAQFLDAHGDGVADIALSCDDVAASVTAAVAGGASLVSQDGGHPVFSGFGNVRHTLLPEPAGGGLGLPAGRVWTGPGEAAAVPLTTGPLTTGPLTTGPAGMIRLLDHIAVCVEGEKLAYYADFYTEAFGLARYSSEYVDLGSQAMDSIVVRSPSGGITFTLVAPDPMKSDAGQLGAFLERNEGAGVQHLAFGVDDIVAAVAEFRDQGVEFLSTPDSYYEMLAERFGDMRSEIAALHGAQVLADRDEWGYLLQLFTRSPHERNTLFYELIQRRGARGFGSANIRALYEAVERDRLRAG
jgi:4-hydroxymandelate synthase